MSGTTTIKHLALEGGGAKCVAFTGALIKLKEMGKLENISEYAGSSGGAIVAGLLAVGYTPEEINGHLINLTFDKIQPPWYKRIVRALTKAPFTYGIYSMKKLAAWYGRLLDDKLKKDNITFAELFQEYGAVKLIITGSNITKGYCEYYSYETHPNMRVLDAVIISASMPWVFDPVIRDDEYLVDGGFLNNYPLYAFNVTDMKRVLGLKLLADGEQPSTERIFMGDQKIKGPLSYTMALVNAAGYQIERLHVKPGYWERTISIPTGDIAATDFDLSLTKRRELIASGYDATCDYFGVARPTRAANFSVHFSNTE